MNASDLAFSNFSILDDSKKLEFIYSLVYNKFDFNNESQPEAWIQPLILSKLYDPFIISSCIAKIFDINIICSELSICYEYPISILDAISFMMDCPNIDYELEKKILSIMHNLIELGAKSGNFILRPNARVV